MEATQEGAKLINCSTLFNDISPEFDLCEQENKGRIEAHKAEQALANLVAAQTNTDQVKNQLQGKIDDLKKTTTNLQNERDELINTNNQLTNTNNQITELTKILLSLTNRLRSISDAPETKSSEILFNGDSIHFDVANNPLECGRFLKNFEAREKMGKTYEGIQANKVQHTKDHCGTILEEQAKLYNEQAKIENEIKNLFN